MNFYQKHPFGKNSFLLIAIGFQLLAIITFSSCDYITTPIINNGTNSTIPPGSPTHVDSTTSSDDALIKILVEDYTAHHCLNCPAAAIQCEDILNGPNGNHAIYMQVNCSQLAQGFPKNSFAGVPDTAYGIDYRTTAGNNWNNTFIDGDNAMPGTMVNRLYYNDNVQAPSPDLYLNGENVSVPFDSLVNTSPVARIHIVDSMYAPPHSTVAMGITCTLLSPKAGVTYYLVAALVEDSIYDWQDSLNVNRQYYLKRMTLRKVVNANGSGWGDPLSNTTAPQTKYYVYANDTMLFNNTMPISLPPKIPTRFWNMAHIYIVAFIYQRTTNNVQDYMVLQAQKLHI